MLTSENATVTLAHSKTQNIEELVSQWKIALQGIS
jgi:5,10-methylene-tetrahydrofolate dehydrogenase/methenyl tetrahydrofolate cyclohydrolase